MRVHFGCSKGFSTSFSGQLLERISASTEIPQNT